MLPNPQYYGNENEWLKATTKPYADDDVANKIPNYRDINSGITAEKLVVNTPLDPSICYAAIAEDSPIAQLYCINGGDYENPLFDYNGDINFIWGYVDTPTALSRMAGSYSININDLSDESETDKLFLVPESQSNYPSNNVHAHFTPFVSIIPRSFVLLIYIECDTEQFNDRRSSALDDYINNVYGVNPTNHPIITAVHVAPLAANTLTGERTFMAINDNGGMSIAYNMPYDLPQLSGIYDYWANRGNVKTTVKIWGNVNSLYYNNTYQYVNGKGGTFNTANSKLTYYKEYGDGEWILQCVASLGLFFAIKRTTAGNGALDDPDMYCGVIDDNGLCHGEYTHGSDNRSQPQYTWASTNDSKYDPIGDPNKYSKETPLPTIRDYVPTYRTYIDDALISSQGGYLLNRIVAEVAGLGTMSWESFFIGQEPLSNIISVKRIFMSSPPTTQDVFPVQMGSYTFEHVSSKMLVGEWSREYLPTVPIWRRYENFMDYEPYTTISLYIPYCGTVKLPCQVFMGHNCNITINRNNRTGLIEAVVMVDNIEFCSLKGDASMDMAVSGLAMAEYITKQKEIQIQKDNLFYSSFNSLMGYAAGATISASMENVGGVVTQGTMAVNSIISYLYQSEVLTYQLDHMAPEQLLIQKADSSVAALNVLTPFIFIERPVFEDGFDDTAKETYSKTVGHACYRVGNLSDFHGLTVCGSVTLDGISCTLDEKLKIVALLKGGVILD